MVRIRRWLGPIGFLAALASLFAPFQMTSVATGGRDVPHLFWTGWDAVTGHVVRYPATGARVGSPAMPVNVAMLAAVVLLVAGALVGAVARPRLRWSAQAVVAGLAGTALALGGWRFHQRVESFDGILGPASTRWGSWVGPVLLASLCAGSAAAAVRAAPDPDPGGRGSARALVPALLSPAGFALTAVCFGLPFRVVAQHSQDGTWQWLLSGWDAVTGGPGAFAARDGRGHDATGLAVSWDVGASLPPHPIGRLMLVALSLVVAGGLVGVLVPPRRSRVASAALAGLALLALVAAEDRLALRTAGFADASAVAGYGYWTAFGLLVALCAGNVAAYRWPALRGVRSRPNADTTAAFG